MSLPLVSVVMPSFQQARFLPDAIDSVLSQDYRPLELIVMDGGSTDGSVEILAGYGDRLTFVSQRDGGQSDAVNQGWRRARGDIVGWLNSDDCYCPGAVRQAVEALTAQPDAGFVYGHGEIIDQTGTHTWPFHANRPFDLWNLIWVADYIMQPAAFARARCVAEVGGVDQDLHFGMDWDLWIKMACRWPVAYVPVVFAQTREYAATKTSRGKWRRLRELRRIMRRHGAAGLPPGLVAYGLDTLRKQWPIVFGPSSKPEALAMRDRFWPRLMRPLHHALAVTIDRRVARGQGVDLDGWVASKAHFAAPWRGQAGEVVVGGEVPTASGSQTLTIECRAVRSTTVVGAGPFELAVAVSAAPGPPRALPLTIRASRRGTKAFRVQSVAFRAS